MAGGCLQFLFSFFCSHLPLFNISMHGLGVTYGRIPRTCIYDSEDLSIFFVVFFWDILTTFASSPHRLAHSLRRKTTFYFLPVSGYKQAHALGAQDCYSSLLGGRGLVPRTQNLLRLYRIHQPLLSYSSSTAS